MAARAETLHALATAHDYPIWRALAVVLRRTKMIADGEVENGLAEVDRGFDLYDDQTTPPVFWPPPTPGAGRRSDDRRTDRGGAGARRHVGVPPPAIDPQTADLAIMRGDLHMAMAPPDVATAEASYQRAFDVAHERGVRLPSCKRRRAGDPAPRHAARAGVTASCAPSTTRSPRATTQSSSAQPAPFSTHRRGRWVRMDANLDLTHIRGALPHLSYWRTQSLIGA